MDYISCSNHNGDTQKCIIVNMSPRISVRYRVHICIQVHIPSSDYLCGLSRLPRKKKSKPNPFSIKIIGLIPFKISKYFFIFLNSLDRILFSILLAHSNHHFSILLIILLKAYLFHSFLCHRSPGPTPAFLDSVHTRKKIGQK